MIFLAMFLNTDMLGTVISIQVACTAFLVFPGFAWFELKIHF